MSKKTIMFTVFVLLGVGTLLFWQYTEPSDTEKTEIQTQSEREKDLGERGEDEKETPDNTIILNNFGQRDDGTIYANATVSGIQNGTCEFQFAYDESSIVKTASIEYVPTGYYACGVRIDSGEFTPKGTWTAQVHIQGVEPKVTSEVKEAEIK